MEEANVFNLDTSTFEKIKSQQNFFYAIVGGLLTSLIAAVIWATVCIGSNHEFGFIAIAVGALVGFSVRFFGAGIDTKFGILGAILSLLGCLLGNLLAQIGFLAKEYSYGYFETFSYLDFSTMISILTETFSAIDLLFYGIAIVEGYKFSFRPMTEETLEDGGDSPCFKYRLPLVIICAIVLSVVYVKVKMGVSGPKIYYYKSGKILSEGELKNSKENGKWTFYFESGNKMSIGYFNMGVRDSSWIWYNNEHGYMESSGSYKNGIETGVWINYYENGVMRDSVCYVNGRMDGKYISRYENGDVMETGYLIQNEKDSIWKTFYENGQLGSTGKMKNGKNIGEWIIYYENGRTSQEVSYDSNENIFIKNVWDKKGNQLVTNGNGFCKLYAENGQVLSSGEVKNGEKTGTWKTFSEDGKLIEEGGYENNIYKIINSWYNDGEEMIKDGNGLYKSYYPDGKTILTTGNIKDGLKEGEWEAYYQSGNLMFQTEYVNGKHTGTEKFYYESGKISLEGKIADDKKEGEWRWYNENGKLSSVAQFHDDKKEGKQIMYDENGDKLKEEQYKNGVLIDTKSGT